MTYGTDLADTAPARHKRHAATLPVVWGWALLATVAFVVLAFSAHTTPYFGVDLTVAQSLQSIHAQWFDILMQAVSWPGFPPQVFIWVGLLVVGFYVARRRREAIFLVFSTAGVGTLGAGVKVLVNRPRPSPALIHVLDPSLNSGKWSFPAGHVESYVAILGFLLFLAYTSSAYTSSGWRLARTLTMIVTAAMIVLIGPSRIYEGEHWFSDVIAGYLLGSVWLVVTVYLYKYTRRPHSAGRSDRVRPINRISNPGSNSKSNDVG
jgi:membrane-associated phospholipid phosphatase